MFSKRRMTKGTESNTDKIERIKRALEEADAVIIGAGAGLSTSAGFTYSGERFHSFFADFEEKYGFHDMYSGGFYPYDTLEEHWAYWSRYIYVNSYQDAPKPTYDKLLGLVKDKDYFVLTTVFRKRDLIKSGCFIRRETTDFFSAVNRVVRKRLTTRRRYERCCWIRDF